MFREEAPPSWSNWNLEMLLLQEEGKSENLEKNPRSKVRTNKTLNSQIAPGRKRTRATYIGGSSPRRALSPLRHPCSPDGLLYMHSE